MQLYTREETIRKINHLGQSCRPFIFIINYLQDASYIEEVASVDPSEVVYNLNGFLCGESGRRPYPQNQRKLNAPYQKQSDAGRRTRRG